MKAAKTSGLTVAQASQFKLFKKYLLLENELVPVDRWPYFQ